MKLVMLVESNEKSNNFIFIILKRTFKLCPISWHGYKLRLVIFLFGKTRTKITSTLKLETLS